MLTPIEQVQPEIFVKREDLAFHLPSPPFAKMRGLFPQLQHLKNTGIQVVGYKDTTTSMAGWGVAFAAKQIGLKAVIFQPTYKDNKLRHNQKFQIKKWKENEATIVPIQSFRSIINWYQAKRILHERYENAYMLEQGLPFDYTLSAVKQQVVPEMRKFKSLVVCIGTGVMTAGILQGLQEQEISLSIYGILVAGKNIRRMNQKIYKRAGVYKNGLFATNTSKLILFAAKQEYPDKEDMACPFPCNPYYDRKAWKWLMDNYVDLQKPILFWNIGA